MKNTTQISDDWIRHVNRAVYYFADEIRGQPLPSLSTYERKLKVRNSSKADTHGVFFHNGEITISVTPYFFPHIRGKQTGGYLWGFSLGSLEESIAYVIAHELRHLWQRGHKPTTWGSRGRYSERDADAFALAFLRHARRGSWLPAIT